MAHFQLLFSHDRKQKPNLRTHESITLLLVGRWPTEYTDATVALWLDMFLSIFVCLIVPPPPRVYRWYCGFVARYVSIYICMSHRTPPEYSDATGALWLYMFLSIFVCLIVPPPPEYSDATVALWLYMFLSIFVCLIVPPPPRV